MSVPGGGTPPVVLATSASGAIPSRDDLILAYKLGLDGYAYRDRLVPQEFARMLAAFVLLASLLVTARTYLQVDRALIMLVVTVAVLGTVALAAFVVDIAANTSCKRALRRDTCLLEEQLFPGWTLPYWAAIARREIFPDENLAKVGGFKGAASTGFVVAARLVFLLWVALCVMAIFSGHLLELHFKP